VEKRRCAKAEGGSHRGRSKALDLRDALGETFSGGGAQYDMHDEVATVEGPELQFARQLYEESLARHGEDHNETRLLSEYISILTGRVMYRPTEIASVLSKQA
jgi:hypothetical protein